MTTTQAAASTSTTIRWVCGACGQPAESGAVHVDFGSVVAAQQAAKEWDARSHSLSAFDLADVFTMPARAQWKVTCGECLQQQHDCGGCYEIGLSQVPTFTALLRWQAHLYDKSWFDATNWVAFVHRLAQEHAPHESAGAW
ncbi:hypothetical protein AB0K35_28230 [Micromonospora sp. NPDC053740]|uniref:hypothetical protein n=1 Tax=Micromonospora sp. NPDC053740 TaxID=3155173 RepID=UPI0034259E31